MTLHIVGGHPFGRSSGYHHTMVNSTSIDFHRPSATVSIGLAPPSQFSILNVEVRSARSLHHILASKRPEQRSAYAGSMQWLAQPHATGVATLAATKIKHELLRRRAWAHCDEEERGVGATAGDAAQESQQVGHGRLDSETIESDAA
jgi:hypothetical protein